MKINYKIINLVFVAAFNVFTYAQQKNIKTPNVILINVDDLGWKDVGYMGSNYYETPNIDKLAKQGMTFTQGYAGAANCAPSRACLMSGQNTPRHGIYTVSPSARGKSKDRKLIPIKNTNTLADSVVTMAEMFKLAGYVTGTFGKWHLSNNPLKDGFDVNVGGDHRGNPGKNGYTAPYNSLPNLDMSPEGENLTDKLTAEAINFVKSNKENPFFLYLPFYAVHTPLMGKADLIKKYENKKNNPWQNNAVYAAMVENVDTNIGRLLNVLNNLKLNKNTLIVFTSDNGGIRAISNQYPLRAGKGSYYEGGVRVPYIFSWPAVIKQNTKNTTPIVNLDLFPTFMKIVNVNLPNKILDGKNILPLLNQKSIEDRALYWHFPIYLNAYNRKKDGGRDPIFRTRPGSTIVVNNWKLHHYFEDDGIELYNLQNDLEEQHNLASKKPKKAKELLGMLNQWRKNTNAPIPNKLNPEYQSKHNK